ncbi:MAG TPA: nitroreductase family deazaflavin-dependent oxidoreductase [Acidimicrobiales bacterium]|nr:nitroreductase family deazaflavin-dependent oxidoreductase [Acidimicrobiales bacterium]
MPLPDSVARFNKAVTNQVTGRFADRLPGFGIVVHKGRRSGTEYRTPVNLVARDGGFTFALTYGRSQWVRNVLAAGGATVITRGRSHAIANPRVAPYRGDEGFPAPARAILRLVDVEEVLLVDESSPPLDGAGSPD